MKLSRIYNKGDINLQTVEGFNKRRQWIKGGHSLKAIEEYSNNVRAIGIIGKGKESNIEGTYEIIYKAGQLEGQDKPIIGEWILGEYKKTIYDSNISIGFADQKAYGRKRFIIKN